MKYETKVSLMLIFVGACMGIVAWQVKTHNDLSLASPFSKSLNVLAIFNSRTKQTTDANIVYGFLPYWTLDQADNFNYNKLTHIAYFGLNIQGDGTFRATVEDENGENKLDGGYDTWKTDKTLAKVINKARDNGIRVALTIIGHEDEVTDTFLNCTECWPVLVNNLAKELDAKGIKDVNINFEHASYVEEDIAQKLTEFAKYLNEELDKKYNDSFVVISVFADSAIKPRATSKVSELAKYTDGIFIMGYDFHQPTSEFAGPVSPLTGIGKVGSYDISTMLSDFLTQAPPNKLILGLPNYGYNWVVENAEPYAKRIEGNDYTGYSQSQPYDNIMDLIEGKTYKDDNEEGEGKASAIGPVEVKWDEAAQVPYFTYISADTNSMRMVYFENADSLKRKIDFARENKLKGVGIWALGYDGERKELWEIF